MQSLSSRTGAGLALPRRAGRGRIARCAKLQTVAVAAGPGSTVRFKIKKQLDFGDKLTVVGSVDQLGKWDANKGLELAWSDGHVWQGEAVLPSGSDVEYKVVVVRGGGGAEWEGGDNRKLKPEGETVEVEAALESASRSNDRDREREERKRREREERKGRGSDGRNGDANVPAAFQGPSDIASRWAGKDIEFMRCVPAAATPFPRMRLVSMMGRCIRPFIFVWFLTRAPAVAEKRSNQHSSDRSGRWDTNGLQGPMLHLVEGDRCAQRRPPGLPRERTVAGLALHTVPRNPDETRRLRLVVGPGPRET